MLLTFSSFLPRASTSWRGTGVRHRCHGSERLGSGCDSVSRAENFWSRCINRAEMSARDARDGSALLSMRTFASHSARAGIETTLTRACRPPAPLHGSCRARASAQMAAGPRASSGGCDAGIGAGAPAVSARALHCAARKATIRRSSAMARGTSRKRMRKGMTLGEVEVDMMVGGDARGVRTGLSVAAGCRGRRRSVCNPHALSGACGGASRTGRAERASRARSRRSQRGPVAQVQPFPASRRPSAGRG